MSAADVPSAVVGVPVDDGSFADARPAWFDEVAELSVAVELEEAEESSAAEDAAVAVDESAADVAVEIAERGTEVVP